MDHATFAALLPPLAPGIVPRFLHGNRCVDHDTGEVFTGNIDVFSLYRPGSRSAIFTIFWKDGEKPPADYRHAIEAFRENAPHFFA